MPIVVGIDEAGYGPLLGPLVVAASVWQVRPEALGSDLWQRLESVVCRKPGRHESRLAINDSKQLYGQRKPLAALERPVLACARVAGAPTQTLGEFIAGLGGLAPAESLPPPWYRELDRPLPLDPERASFAGVAARLERAMDAAGVRCRRLLAELVPEHAFNQRLRRTRNKAAILVEHVLRLVRRSAEDAGEQDVHVDVDRLGGRQDYRRLLLTAFPARHLHIERQDPTCTRYRLAGARNDWWLTFSVDADRKHLPVALSSMLAKYLREAIMQQFNAFWRQLLPELRPTAGYYQDARRFLREIAPVLTRSGLSKGDFVRLR